MHASAIACTVRFAFREGEEWGLWRLLFEWN